MNQYYNPDTINDIGERKFIVTKKDKRKDILQQIGIKCRAYRHSLSLTLRETSEQTGYSVANLSKFERGHCDSAILLCMYAQLKRKDRTT